jgi:SAM-dependent methyltransferase
MNVAKHIKLFDRIAGIYNWFHSGQLRRYTKIIGRYAVSLYIPAGGAILDIGCGTGAFAGAFARFGYRVIGVDGSPRMAAKAAAHGVESRVADGTHPLDFPNGEFDLVCASYVAHGLERPERTALFREMKRISRGTVLLHDFSPADRKFSSLSVIGILEYLEGSDYVSFRKNALGELGEIFATVEIIRLNKKVSWYVCGVTSQTSGQSS